VFAWQGNTDALYAIRCLLDALGGADQQDRRYVADLAAHAPAEPERALSPEEIEDLLIHPDERGALYQVLSQGEATLRKAFPHVERSVQRPEKITARSHPELGALLNRLKKLMGGVSIAPVLVDGGIEALRVEDTSPPTLYIGREMVEELAAGERVFELARKVAEARLSHPLYRRLEPGVLGRAVAALLSATCQSFQPPYPTDEVEDTLLKVNRGLSKKLRRKLESPALELADRTIDPGRWRMAMEQSEDRVALALGGDPRAALACLLRQEGGGLSSDRRHAPEALARIAGPRTRQLISFIVSEEYLLFRARVGLAVE
jgi:hypothetical protein